MKPSSTSPKFFTVKELFFDVNGSEIRFLNNQLKRLLKLHEAPTPPQVVIGDEDWPSNQWPFWCAEHACALLTAFRAAKNLDYIESRNFLEGSIEKYIDYPLSKGWGYTTFYDCEWEDEFIKYKKLAKVKS